MKTIICYLGVSIVAVLLSGTVQARSNLTDAEIRDQMIQESAQSYAGACPCPYSATRNGSRCGGRSAYSKPGGASPLCYPQDISENLLRAYKQKNGL